MNVKLTNTAILCFLVCISFAAISPSKSCAVPPYDTSPGLKQPCDVSGDERHVGNRPGHDVGKPHDDMMTMSGWRRYQSFRDAETRGQIPLPDEFSRPIEGEVPPVTRTIPEDFHLKRTSGHSPGNAGTARSETSFTTIPPWVIETVDAPKEFSDFGPRAIAVDVDDNPHIVYGGDHLYYAYQDSSGWHYETVDGSSGVGTHASLGIDSLGKVHISYLGNGGLKYATNKSGSWVAETVDSMGSVGRFTSLAIDSTDKVHISYDDRSNFYLKYATNKSGSWVAETVDSQAHLGGFLYISLAIDSMDKAHISYYTWNEGYLRYATNQSGSWTVETIDAPGHVYPDISLAIDSTDKVHISYFADGGLKYATNQSGSWVTETVMHGISIDNSLAIDSMDKVHISYHHWSYSNLAYATNKSGSWVIETVDSEEYVGFWTSLAIDSTDKVHISYYDRWNGDLKYATNKSGSWVAKTVDSGGSTGWYTSLAIDSTDKVHISYHDESNRSLKFATNKSGSWLAGTVDSEGDSYGYDTSLAIDSTGKVHISYYDGSNGDLKYASSLETVNDLVTLEPIESTYQTTSDTTGCPPGFVGKFSFDAKLTNKGDSPPLSNLVVLVKKLTNGNLLHNADGGHGGEGSIMTIPLTDSYSDGVLSPGEFVDVHFIICLKEKKPFTLLMDVLGVKEAGETNVSQVAEFQGTNTESRRVKFRKGSRMSGKGFFCRFRP